MRELDFHVADGFFKSFLAIPGSGQMSLSHQVERSLSRVQMTLNGQEIYLNPPNISDVRVKHNTQPRAFRVDGGCQL